MKVSFFTAALLGMFAATNNAISLQGHDFDFADYELAETDSKGEGQGKGSALTEADCE